MATLLEYNCHWLINES